MRVEVEAIEHRCAKRGRDPERAVGMWLALNCNPRWKKYKNTCRSWITSSFSQWVLELQEGDRLLGTSLAGLVLLQPVPSPDAVRASLSLLPAAASQLEDVSQYGRWTVWNSPLGKMPLGAVGWDPAGADPCGGCRGRRRAGRGRRRCQQGKESLGEQQTLSQDRLCACRHPWALLPGGGRGIAEQQIWAKRCGGFWGLLGPLKFPYLKRQERGGRRCVMVSDLFSSIQRLFRVAQHQQLRPLPLHYLPLAAALLPPNTLSPWGDTSCPSAQGERVPPFANRSHAW